MSGAGLDARARPALHEHIVTTIPVAALGRQIGYLLDEQEARLTDALRAAIDLD